MGCLGCFSRPLECACGSCNKFKTRHQAWLSQPGESEIRARCDNVPPTRPQQAAYTQTTSKTGNRYHGCLSRSIPHGCLSRPLASICLNGYALIYVPLNTKHRSVSNPPAFSECRASGTTSCFNQTRMYPRQTWLFQPVAHTHALFSHHLSPDGQTG